MARILVIDEEPLIHEVISAVLEAEGLRVEAVADLSSAHRLAEQPIDLILLHQALPEDQCLKLMAKARRLRDPALVLLSSQRNAESERIRRRLQADDVIYKPIDPLVLRSKVAAHLRRLEPSAVPSSPRLLVVDDDPLVLASVIDILNDNGFRAVGVASGEEGLNRLREESFEIVMTDVMMEGMSGLDLVREVADSTPETVALVMTGYASKNVAISALRHGAMDFLEKPLTPDGVLRAVERVWRWQRSELENRRLLAELQRINRDLTEAKEKAEEASRAKSEFLATISHELRTPLNGVMGCLSLVRSSALTAKNQRFVSTAQEAGQNLLSLITEVLDFAALESTMPRMEWLSIDVAELISHCVERSRPAVESAGLSLDLRMELPGSLRMQTDPRRLGRVLGHLLDNGRKFTPAGGIEVRVRDTGEHLEISVRDSGIGMGAAQQDHIFEPFRQLDEGTTRAAGGLGLGLAVSRRLAELLAGELCLVNTMGKEGSELKLVLPKEPPNAGPIHKVEENGHRVMVLERDPVEGFLTEAMLRQCGFQPIRVANPSDALATHNMDPFRFALMDGPLAGASNDATPAQRWRILEAERDIPAAWLVALVDFEQEELEQRCLEVGFNQCLRRPLRLSRVATLLEQAARR